MRSRITNGRNGRNNAATRRLRKPANVRALVRVGYFGSEADSDAPDGQLDAGTKVALLRYDGGARCRVADGRGLYVEISYANLAKLEGS
jgi:hypothetical protein